MLVLLGKAESKQEARLHVLLSLLDSGGAVQSVMERIAGNVWFGGVEALDSTEVHVRKRAS
jgi:hypothetical protein